MTGELALEILVWNEFDIEKALVYARERRDEIRQVIWDRIPMEARSEYVGFIHKINEF